MFQGWEKLALSDMLVAYRKAKADNFFENIFPSSSKFAEYERDLINNLKKLLKRLQSNNGFENCDDLLGIPRLIPKKLTSECKKKNENIHFSDPTREFISIKENLHAEFRVVGDFPIDTHIISALWINMIGYKFDAVLSHNVYSARLKRINNDGRKLESFHLSAIDSFEPYYHRYQKWREDSLKAIRDNLHNNRNVIAASLDLENFFHNIDPSFLSSDAFVKELIGKRFTGLSEDETKFNVQMSLFLKCWSDKASSLFDNSLFKGGLVIGLTATRVISNIILYKFDKLVKEKITPIHYGRYVDDLLLVILDPGNISNIVEFMDYLKNRLGNGYLSNDNEKWSINLGEDYQRKSIFQFHSEKQKLFVLEGQAGCDLLDSIEKEINELSSEHRLMPMPDQLDQTTAARVLSASDNTREQADTFHRADGLTIRRLSWVLQLRHFELLARDLPANEWKEERKEFYQFIKNHIIRTDKFFEFYKYLPRILGFAINQGELNKALDIVNCTFKCVEELKDVNKIKINGKEIPSEIKNDVLNKLEESLIEVYKEALFRYLDLSNYINKNKHFNFSEKDKNIIQQILSKLKSSGPNIIFEKSKKLLISDLATIPYKEFLSKAYAKSLLHEFNSDKQTENEIMQEFQKAELLNTQNLKEFLNRRKKTILQVDFYCPFLFPTRPYTPEEIASISPECIWPQKSKGESPRAIWSKYVQALKGVWINPSVLDEEVNLSEKNIIRVGSLLKDRIIVAITSLKTSEEEWAYSACGKPSLTLKRYKRISKLINQALQLSPKPDYLIFPELSIPIDWIPSISNRLLKSGISLIAGTEYRGKKENKIFSEACLCLIDNSLGYPASIRIWQPKLNPAVGEEYKLLSIFGKTWYKDKKSLKETIYNHNNFYFGVMVCSELQNSKLRISYQGTIDALMILSWNKDIETFSKLIESAALDLHAYIIMVNNRKYGDSRVRVPSKQEFKRDLVRLRGGKNDFLVSVELDINALRTFQSRAKSWPRDEDPFKPVPEGFESSPGRKKIPPR